MHINTEHKSKTSTIYTYMYKYTYMYIHTHVCMHTFKYLHTHPNIYLTPHSHYSLTRVEHSTARNKLQCESIERFRTRSSTARQEEVGWHGLARAGIQCERIPGWSTRAGQLRLTITINHTESILTYFTR